MRRSIQRVLEQPIGAFIDRSKKKQTSAVRNLFTRAQGNKKFQPIKTRQNGCSNNLNKEEGLRGSSLPRITGVTTKKGDGQKMTPMRNRRTHKKIMIKMCQKMLSKKTSRREILRKIRRNQRPSEPSRENIEEKDMTSCKVKLTTTERYIEKNHKMTDTTTGTIVLERKTKVKMTK